MALIASKKQNKNKLLCDNKCFYNKLDILNCLCTCKSS